MNDYDLYITTDSPINLAITPEESIDVDLYPEPINIEVFAEDQVSLELATVPIGSEGPPGPQGPKGDPGINNFIPGEGIALVGDELRLSFDNLPELI